MCSHPLHVLSVNFLFRDQTQTHRQTLNQEELLASVLGQRRNGELSEQLERVSADVSVREGFMEEEKAEDKKECPRVTKRH